MHHSFQDPPKLAANLISEEDKLDVYRKVRDQIKDYLKNEFLSQIKGW